MVFSLSGWAPHDGSLTPPSLPLPSALSGGVLPLPVSERVHRAAALHGLGPHGGDRHQPLARRHHQRVRPRHQPKDSRPGRAGTGDLRDSKKQAPHLLIIQPGNVNVDKYLQMTCPHPEGLQFKYMVRWLRWPCGL